MTKEKQNLLDTTRQEQSTRTYLTVSDSHQYEAVALIAALELQAAFGDFQAKSNAAVLADTFRPNILSPRVFVWKA